ncbi:MAG: hypothetical protein ACKVOK_06310 [Flavobacteriales bacterium]
MKPLQTTATLLTIAITILLFTACNKQEEEPDDSNGTLPNLNIFGCLPQVNLQQDVNPRESWEYSTAFPGVLENYKIYNTTTDQVQESYRFTYQYNSDLNQALIDSIYFYFGDYQLGQPFYEAKKFHYDFLTPTEYRIVGADVFANDGGFPAAKGAWYFDFSNEGLVEVAEYLDDTVTVYGSFSDNVRNNYYYDDTEAITNIVTHNYNNVLVAEDTYIPSAEYWPSTWWGITHPLLSWGMRYAPIQATYYTQGFGTFTYEYQYQSNADGYIIESSWMNGTTPVLIGLYEWECY